MKYIIYIALALFFITSCKPEEEEAPVTSMEVKILDDEGAFITDPVNVYLFTVESSFISSVTNESPSGYIAESISIGGSVTFENLDPATPYFVYIYYDGKGYALNNYFTQYKIQNFLQVDKKTIAVIQLTPYKIANIGFYSTSALNLNGKPVKIYFGSDRNSIGTLTSISPTIPSSIDDLGVVKVLYQNEGLHNWSATGANGCHWQGQVNVSTNASGPTFVPVLLDGCNNGIYAFWTTAANLTNSGGNIRVVFDNVDEVGTITTSRSSTPNTCKDSGILLVSRPPGTYPYHAYSANGLCSWQGSITIGSDDCSVVLSKELKGCN